MGMIKPGHRYSFSQLSSFDDCPFGFYLQRIMKTPTVSNGFAEQGSLIHSLIDEWARGKLTKDELPAEYEKRYPKEVTTSFPKLLSRKGYEEKTYQQGLEYFENFDCFKGYDILASETSHTTDIAGRPFVGIVDMVLRDQKTDEIIICDHKSKSLSSFLKNADTMYRQQLLYAKLIHEKYNLWPDRMMFNLFKENGLKQERLFTKEAYEENLQWAEDVIRKIEEFDELDWLERKKKDFFCTEICSVRGDCPNGHW